MRQRPARRSLAASAAGGAPPRLGAPPPPRADLPRRLALLASLLAPATGARMTNSSSPGPTTPVYKGPPDFTYADTGDWPSTFPACGASGVSTPFPLTGPFTPAPARRLAPAYRPAAFVCVNERTTAHFVAPAAGGGDPNDGAAGGIVAVDANGVETRLRLVQFHFHVPGEEAFSGAAPPSTACVHLVHVADDDPDAPPRTLVVAAQLAEVAGAGAHAGVAAALAALGPGGRPPPGGGRTPPIDARALLPASLTAGRAFWFRGGFSSPPCSAGVDWCVLEAPSPIAPGQMDALRYPPNARPLQARGGRRVEVSGGGL
jgi:hypothetical protein